MSLGTRTTVNLTATDSAGFGAIIIVMIEVAEAAFHRYDLDGSGTIERHEVIAAIGDYFAGLIPKDVRSLRWSSCTSVARHAFWLCGDCSYGERFGGSVEGWL